MNGKMSKRKQTAIRFFSYGMMTLATIVISLICILLILGYRFDTTSGTIEQGGLVQFRSFPSGATITMNDKRLGFRSPGKLNVDAGPLNVTMSLNGYHSWSKVTSVKPGELKWLNYARMIPKEIKTSNVASYKSMAGSLPSPDRRWLALLPDSKVPSVVLYDIRNPQRPTATTITVPAEVYETTDLEAVHNFSLVEWDFGARYILLKHSVGKSVQYLRLDRTVRDNAVNITREFNLPFRDIHFSGTSGNVYYALNGKDIRKVDLGARSVSQPLVSDVDHFELYKSDIIAYVATHEDKRVAGVFIDNKDTVVRSYPADASVLIDISSYFDHEYLAIAHGRRVEILKDPLENADSAGRVFAEYEAEYGIKWLQFSSSGRFAVAGDGSRYTTYDIETDDQYVTTFPGRQIKADKPLQWLDDYYLVSLSGDKLRIGEFDGSNQHDIAAAAPGFKVTLSDDGKYLFSIGKSKDGYILQSSKITLD